MGPEASVPSPVTEHCVSLRHLGPRLSMTATATPPIRCPRRSGCQETHGCARPSHSPQDRHACGLQGHRPAGHAADTVMSPSGACRGPSVPLHHFLTQKQLFPVGTPRLPEQAPRQAVLTESPVSSGQVASPHLLMPGPPQGHRRKAPLCPGGLSPLPPAVIETVSPPPHWDRALISRPRVPWRFPLILR